MCGLTQTPKREVPLPSKLGGDLKELQNPFNQQFREQNQYEHKLNKVFSCPNCLHSGFQSSKWELPKGRAGEGMEGGCSCGCQEQGAVSPGLQCHGCPVPSDTSWGCQCIPAMPLSHPALDILIITQEYTHCSNTSLVNS